MLAVPQELSFLCVARKRDEDFIDLYPHPCLLRMCGDPPYYLVRVTLDGDGRYWGWWVPDDSIIPIHHIYPAKVLLEICFAYGSKAEEDRDRGRVVRVSVEEVRPLTSEEERTKNTEQIPELPARTPR